MKTIYVKINSFFKRHYRVGFVISAGLFVISCIALLYSPVRLMAAIPFAFLLDELFRLVTYKIGKIPLFMHDKTWSAYQMKYSQEDVEEKYKQMSIKRATVDFMIAVSGFVVMIACELLFLI